MIPKKLEQTSAVFDCYDYLRSAREDIKHLQRAMKHPEEADHALMVLWALRALEYAGEAARCLPPHPSGDRPLWLNAELSAWRVEIGDVPAVVNRLMADYAAAQEEAKAALMRAASR